MILKILKNHLIAALSKKIPMLYKLVNYARITNYKLD